MKKSIEITSRSLLSLLIALCSQVGNIAGEGKEGKMEFDIDGTKTGLQISAESIWRNNNGKTCLLDIALRNVAEQDINSRSTDIKREYGIRIWTPRGKLLAATPPPEPWPPVTEGRDFKNIRTSLKPGEKKTIVSLAFVGLYHFARDQPVIVQVLRYFEDSPYVLVSAPVLIEPGDGTIRLSEPEDDAARDEGATRSET